VRRRRLYGMETDPVAFLEETVPIESHESVEEMREYLLENVTGASAHESGCVVAEKGGSRDGNGDERETVLLRNTHMDTVRAARALERDEGVVRGRGACDAKASLAAMVAAYERSDASQRAVRLVVSPDEETTSQGINDYLRSEDAATQDVEFAVVGEPTELDLCTAAKGRFEATVVFHGESAHAASGDGRNAVSYAAEAVRRLEALEPSYDEVLGESRLTVTRFEGGESANQVPERASITLDRRPVPPETENEFVGMVKDALEGIDCEHEVVLPDSPSPESTAFRTDEEDAHVRRLRDCVKEALVGTERKEDEGVEVEVDLDVDVDVRPFGAACEASYISSYAPVVVFGPGAISEEDGTPVAHSEREYVPTDEVRMAADALTGFLQSSE